MSFTVELLREGEGTEDQGAVVGSQGSPDLSRAWRAASQLPASGAAYEQGCEWKCGAKSRKEPVLRRWQGEKLAAGESDSDIPRASRDARAGRAGVTAGRLDARCLFFLCLLSKMYEFFSG